MRGNTMKRGLAMVLGATIGASLLVIDAVFQIPILTNIGLTYSFTIIVGLIVGIILIVLTDNDWFEDLVGIRNIEVLPNVCRWISYNLFALSLLLLLNDLTPTIAHATGLPVDSMFLAAGTFLAGLVTVVKEILTGST